MNEDTSLMRVAIRSEVIPVMERALGREVRGTLARTASLLREDAQLLERMAAEAEVGWVQEPGLVRLEARSLGKLPRPVASRIVRRALLALGALPEASHVRAIVDLATEGRRRRLTVSGGLVAAREREYVLLSRSSPMGSGGR